MNLYETENWIVDFVDIKQNFLGRCKIISKKNKRELSGLTTEEWRELGIIEKTLESVCKQLFNATMFNFACLTNFAYKDKQQAIIHFHFILRYNHTVNIFNKKYKDKYFDYKLWHWYNNKFKHQKNIFSKEEIEKIYNMIKINFDINIKKVGVNEWKKE